MPIRGGECRAQRRAVADLDDAVAALALLWFAGALELDQLRTTGLLPGIEHMGPTRWKRVVAPAYPTVERARCDGERCE
jgi:hypothetical protein